MPLEEMKYGPSFVDMVMQKYAMYQLQPAIQGWLGMVKFDGVLLLPAGWWLMMMVMMRSDNVHKANLEIEFL